MKDQIHLILKATSYSNKSYIISYFNIIHITFSNKLTNNFWLCRDQKYQVSEK